MNEKPPRGELTQFANAWREGNQEALNELISLSYQELRYRAKGLIYRKNINELHPTELVHETFVRLTGTQPREMENREAFFRFAGLLMRNVLIDKFRAMQAQRRGGGAETVSMQSMLCPLANDKYIPPDKLFDVHEAIEKLKKADKTSAQVIELSLFVGLTKEEIALALEITPSQVRYKRKFAKKYIKEYLDDLPSPNPKSGGLRPAHTGLSPNTPS